MISCEKSASIKEKAHVCKAIVCFLVPVVGVEPTRYRYHWILSPARLPIPSYRRTYDIISQDLEKIKYFFTFFENIFRENEELHRLVQLRFYTIQISGITISTSRPQSEDFAIPSMIAWLYRI